VVGAFAHEPPVEFAVGVPFGALAEFAAHEEKFLAGESPLVGEEGAEVGEGVPVVAGRRSEPFPWTTSSWLKGRTKFS
jgi:hypothetical protein